MSKYTTGEIAKLCGVTVRTVQYYDTRGILTPSELTEGGRRLYSEDDLRRMKIICFLRELDIPIKSIGELFAEENPESVISLILDEQEKNISLEINERQLQLDKLHDLRHALKTVKQFSVESIGDIAHIVENKKKLRKVRAELIIIGVLMNLIQIGTLLLWIQKGIWIPFAASVGVCLALGVWVSWIYSKKLAYICPKCHTVFRPKFKQAFWARHTPNTRKLTCTDCGHHGFCVETYWEDIKNG